MMSRGSIECSRSRGIIGRCGRCGRRMSSNGCEYVCWGRSEYGRWSGGVYRWLVDHRRRSRGPVVWRITWSNERVVIVVCSMIDRANGQVRRCRTGW